MKRFTHLLFVILCMVLSAVPVSSWGQDIADKVLMPQFGKQTIIVSDEIVFYDFKENQGIAAQAANNSLALTVFKPSEQGKAIQITFETFDIIEHSVGYMAYMQVYSGIADPNDEFAFPTATGQVLTSSKLPLGNVLETIKGTHTNKSYISVDPTGTLSVGFIYRNSSNSKGWKAKVSCVTVENMSVTEAGSSYDYAGIEPYAGKKSVNLLSLYVDTEGIMNPEKLTSCSFTLPVNEGVTDPAQLKLYAGTQLGIGNQDPLDAKMTESNGIYTFILEKALISGRNWFSVVSDIRQDAAFGKQVQAVAAKVTTTTHPNGVPGLVAAPAIMLTVPHMVLMSATSSIYRIGAKPVSFYDDGGKEGNVSDKYSGQVTFEPTSVGKKVMVTFTKLDLFNTNPSNNDILNIYNGKEVNAAQLSATLLKQTGSEPIIVKSVSADGSLTVTLESTTGVTKSGFEAIVTEFEPQEMTLDTIVAWQYTTGTVVAGDTNQPILSFSIRTKNTEPALVPAKFSFTTNGYFSNIVKATLYATKSSAGFETRIKVGETEISTDTFDIICVDATSLTEGDNHFWLAYDVGQNVVNGDKIDATITDVTLNSKAYLVAFGSPEGNRTVKNEFISSVGTFEKKVIGSWAYMHTESYGKYKAETGDQIVTFLPATKGELIELDFVDFDLYYAISSSGTRAKFEIYSGRGTEGPKLWELVKAEDKTTGPGKVLRSQAGDGSITIVFNANTSNSSEAAKGWHAQVREYKPSVMRLKSVTAFQASTDMIRSGIVSENQEIIGFKIVTEGNLSGVILTGLALDMKGCQKEISKVTVYCSGSDSIFITANPVASVVPGTASSAMDLSLDIPMELQEGSSYFWVTYDTKEDIPAGLDIDARLKSVTLATGIKTLSAGDPEGERRTMNIYLMKNGEQQINVESSVMFYDDGGVNGNYSKMLEGTVTFVPKAGDVIKMVFKRFNTYVNDDFYIYNGRETTAANQLAKYYNEKTDLPDLVSTADDGSMTIKFKATSNLKPGWEIEVLSYTPKPLSLGVIKATAVNSPALLKGMKGVPMLRVDVEIKGDKGVVDITRFNFNKMNTTEISVTAAHVYCTDTIGKFITDSSFAEAVSTAPYTFDGSYKITRSGVYKFWFAYDIASTAAVYDKIETKFTDLVIDGSLAEPAEPLIASASIKKGFSGTYTVGEDANYLTIASAIAAMKGGIDGPVVFELENGIYNELVEIPEIEGASDINTVTIKSKSGRYQDVIISYDKYDEAKDDYGVCTVSGADNLTLDGITFKKENSDFPILLHVKNMSRYLTVKNCRIFAEMSTTYGGTCLIYTDVSKGANNDYLTLENNLIEGGYNGLGMYGGSVLLSKPKGTRILNNTFRNQGAKGIYFSSPGEVDLLVSGNVIDNSQTTKTDFNAMDITVCEGFILSGNIITLATKNYATGIYLRKAAGVIDKPGRIFNNEVTIACAGSSASYGINLTSTSTYLELTNNSVRISGSSANSAAINWNAAMENMLVQNNIFQNESKGYVYRLSKNAYLEGTIYSNNMLYTRGGVFAYAGSEMAAFENWKTISKEENSYVEQTLFLSGNVLEPAESGNLNHGKPLAYVTTDLNGIARSTTAPTIGAYEYTELTETSTLIEGYPIISGIKYSEAVVTIRTSLSGKAFFLVRRSEEAAPSIEEVIATKSIETRRGKEFVVTMDGLEHQTDYKCYIVLQNLKNQNSVVLASEVFSTSYLPTEVSTFEQVSAKENGFEDGTAAFVGFTVVNITDGIGSDNKKAAQINQTGTVSLTNSTRGIKLTGFYLKSDAEVTLAVTRTESDKSEKTFAATDGKWIFCNLKDMGKIVSLTLTTASAAAFIDNFSGEPQPIRFALEDKSANEGDEVTLSAAVLGGVAPYTYIWKNAKREVVASTATYTFTPNRIGEYTLIVTDAWNTSAVGNTLVNVEGNAYVATFEDLYLEPNSYWRGDEKNGGLTRFYSGSYGFDNSFTKEWSSWSGFAYSNEAAGASNSEFLATAGSGANGSVNYAVAYIYSLPTLTVTNKAEGDSIRGCYITNTAWVKDAILNGDGMSTVPGGFAKGDYLTLTATGYNAVGTVTSDMVYYLADYRSDNAVDRYYLNTWEWMDLRLLGKVNKISFSLESTKKNSYGMTTPAYFCLDDVNSGPNIADKTLPALALGKTSIPLAQFFTFDNDLASTVYSMESGCDNSRIEVAISDDRLEIDGKEDKTSASVLVKAIRKGQIQFARIALNVDQAGAGVAGENVRQVTIYPVPARENLTVVTDMENYTIEIISANGARVWMQIDNSGETSIHVGNLENGFYILRLSNEEQTLVKRFAKVG